MKISSKKKWKSKEIIPRPCLLNENPIKKQFKNAMVKVRINVFLSSVQFLDNSIHKEGHQTKGALKIGLKR